MLLLGNFEGVWTEHVSRAAKFLNFRSLLSSIEKDVGAKVTAKACIKGEIVVKIT